MAYRGEVTVIIENPSDSDGRLSEIINKCKEWKCTTDK